MPPPTPFPPFVWESVWTEELETHRHEVKRARLGEGWLYHWSCHCHDPARVVIGASAAAMVYVPDK